MRLFKRNPNKMMCDYTADALGVRYKSLDWRDNDNFASAWAFSMEHAKKGWDKIPDIRWRAHMNLWAAQNALQLEGDLVECGVYTGIYSLTICEYLQFQNIDKKFYLFDLWDTIPTEHVLEGEKELVSDLNKTLYASHNIYESTKQIFSKFPNCQLVRGLVPDTLTQAPEKISYLSVDMNNTYAEKAAIEFLWPRLTTGAIVVIDDYAWNGHKDQRHMWDAFAAKQGLSICNVPTGQGLLMKTR